MQKPGDLSDAVEAEGSYHLIQLIDRIPPTAVKFEDVRESVRQDLSETLTQAAIKDLRAQIGQIAAKEMQIQDPVLKQQFQDRFMQRRPEIQGRDAVREQLRNQRPMTTAPATNAPAAATEPARPPQRSRQPRFPPRGRESFPGSIVYCLPVSRRGHAAFYADFKNRVIP